MCISTLGYVIVGHKERVNWLKADVACAGQVETAAWPEPMASPIVEVGLLEEAGCRHLHGHVHDVVRLHHGARGVAAHHCDGGWWLEREGELWLVVGTLEGLMMVLDN